MKKNDFQFLNFLISRPIDSWATFYNNNVCVKSFVWRKKANSIAGHRNWRENEKSSEEAQKMAYWIYPWESRCRILCCPKGRQPGWDYNLVGRYNRAWWTPLRMHSCLGEPFLSPPRTLARKRRVFYFPWTSTFFYTFLSSNPGKSQVM